jgi:hypothetical protein
MVPKWIDKKPEIRKLKKWEASWLAGCIDSDGSIGFYNYGPEGKRACLQFGNTSRELLKQVRDTIGCGSSVLHIPNPSHKGRKTMYYYTLKGSCRCYWILRQIVSFLIVKRQKALDIIQLLESKPFGRYFHYTQEYKVACSKRMKKIWKKRKQEVKE